MKLVILDRDGTINHDSDHYIKSLERVAPIKGSIEAIARLTQAGYRIVVGRPTSPALPRGSSTRARCSRSTRRCSAAASQAGPAASTPSSFCPPCRRFACCTCRKPEPGMLLEIARRFNVSLKDVYMVGDALRTRRRRRPLAHGPVLVLTGKGTENAREGGLPPGTEVSRSRRLRRSILAP
jgi:D-glycero-D-manno-heptose 1,7-bisphosphate phosphatase